MVDLIAFKIWVSFVLVVVGRTSVRPSNDGLKSVPLKEKFNATKLVIS